jgi:hypothetical protein
MGTYWIDGHCVDLITYARAYQLAREETGLSDPPKKHVERLALNRRQRILNQIKSDRIAEGAD